MPYYCKTKSVHRPTITYLGHMPYEKHSPLTIHQHTRLWAVLYSSFQECPLLNITDRLIGLVVRRPPWEGKFPGSNPACTRIFSGSSHTSDSNIGTPAATLPGAWCYRVSAGTGQPSVSILWLGEVESLICNLYLSVAAHKIVWADPSLRYTGMLLGR